MQRVIVTVQGGSGGRARDLEVPAEVEAGRLAELIVRALRWEDEGVGPGVGYEIEAHPPGRVLGPRETLASAGAWDGSWLVLQPARNGSGAARGPGRPGASPAPWTPGSAARPGTASGPVSRWRPLGIEVPANPSPSAPEEPGSGSRFAWRQLDTESGTGSGG